MERSSQLRPSSSPARVKRRERILRLLDQHEPDWCSLSECRHAALCSEAEAIVELQWLRGNGRVEADKSAYGMKWRVVR